MKSYNKYFESPLSYNMSILQYSPHGRRSCASLVVGRQQLHDTRSAFRENLEFAFLRNIRRPRPLGGLQFIKPKSEFGQIMDVGFGDVEGRRSSGYAESGAHFSRRAAIQFETSESAFAHNMQRS